MDEEYKELKCTTCQAGTNAWYVDCGAPFYQMFICSSCKDEQENDNENED